MTQKDIEQFISNHTLTTISTFGKEYPESAVIEFASSGLELIFDTHTTSRKYQNLMQNPRASFVIGWDKNKTVQYEGEVIELKGDELTKYKEIYFAKMPEAKEWEHAKDITYFKVLPRWIRYTDLNVHPWQVEEMTYA